MSHHSILKDKNTNELIAWGTNSFGQFGNGKNRDIEYLPISIKIEKKNFSTFLTLRSYGKTLKVKTYRGLFSLAMGDGT